jgi:hypothetical protein
MEHSCPKCNTRFYDGEEGEIWEYIKAHDPALFDDICAKFNHIPRDEIYRKLMSMKEEGNAKLVHVEGKIAWSRTKNAPS